MTEVLEDRVQLNTIEEAIAEIRGGKVIIVVDDENRENEGDFIAAAEMVTPEMINFMATHGRGLICAPLTEERCRKLELNMMVENNTVLHNTQFTVSVDLLGYGCTTGISAHDRARTVAVAIDGGKTATDIASPGHVFPLRARQSARPSKRPNRTVVVAITGRLRALCSITALSRVAVFRVR